MKKKIFYNNIIVFACMISLIIGIIYLITGFLYNIMDFINAVIFILLSLYLAFLNEKYMKDYYTIHDYVVDNLDKMIEKFNNKNMTIPKFIEVGHIHEDHFKKIMKLLDLNINPRALLYDNLSIEQIDFIDYLLRSGFNVPVDGDFVVYTICPTENKIYNMTSLFDINMETVHYLYDLNLLLLNETVLCPCGCKTGKHYYMDMIKVTTPIQYDNIKYLMMKDKDNKNDTR